MDKFKLTVGEGRTKVDLLACNMGEDLVILIYNDNAHIGAVAIGEYDQDKKRASTSVITRLGHKDDVVAQKGAYLVSKSTKKPVCVIAGIHVNNITTAEIDEIVENASRLVDEILRDGTVVSHGSMGFDAKIPFEDRRNWDSK